MTKFPAVLCVICTGCYFYYPKISTKRIAKVEGAVAEIDADSGIHTESCTRDIKACEGKTELSYTVKWATTKYNGERVSQFNFRSLVDPEFEAKIAKIRDRKGVCNLSLIPSAVAVAGVIAGFVVLAKKDSFGDDAQKYSAISAGVAAGGALLSYPIGGFACWKANREFKAMFPSNPKKATFSLSGSSERSNTVEYYEEMKKLAADFNAKLRGGAAPADESTNEGASESTDGN